MKKITSEERERIGKAMSKLKYRLYQAEIGFLSHDYERLNEMVGKIGTNVRKIKTALKEKTTLQKTKIRSGRVNRTRRIRIK